MKLVNQGNIPTCVRPQDTSVVDLTWTTSGLVERVKNWRVLHNPDEESFSDHRYIRFDLIHHLDSKRHTLHDIYFKKWSLIKFDKNMFAAVILQRFWSVTKLTNTFIDKIVSMITGTVFRACDFAAPKVRHSTTR